MLASELGVVDVDDILDLDYHKLLEWAAFYQIRSEPNKQEMNPADFQKMAAQRYGKSR